MGLLYIAFIILGTFLLFLVSSIILSWKDVEFCQTFSAFIKMIIFFVFASIYMLYYIYCFAYIEPSLHPWNETDLIMMWSFCCVVEFSLPVFYGEFLCLYLLKMLANNEQTEKIIREIIPFTVASKFVGIFLNLRMCFYLYYFN
jgi:hypothetical protein